VKVWSASVVFAVQFLPQAVSHYQLQHHSKYLKNEENIKHISSFILNDGNGCM
jgi:hypothetical protein